MIYNGNMDVGLKGNESDILLDGLEIQIKQFDKEFDKICQVKKSSEEPSSIIKSPKRE